jgi:hypothetical protein
VFVLCHCAFCACEAADGCGNFAGTIEAKVAFIIPNLHYHEETSF